MHDFWLNFWLSGALAAACFAFLTAGCAWWYAADEGNDLLGRSIAATASGLALIGVTLLLLFFI